MILSRKNKLLMYVLPSSILFLTLLLVTILVAPEYTTIEKYVSSGDEFPSIRYSGDLEITKSSVYDTVMKTGEELSTISELDLQNSEFMVQHQEVLMFSNESYEVTVHYLSNMESDEIWIYNLDMPNETTEVSFFHEQRKLVFDADNVSTVLDVPDIVYGNYPGKLENNYFFDETIRIFLPFSLIPNIQLNELKIITTFQYHFYTDKNYVSSIRTFNQLQRSLKRVSEVINGIYLDNMFSVRSFDFPLIDELTKRYNSQLDLLNEGITAIIPFVLMTEISVIMAAAKLLESKVEIIELVLNRGAAKRDMALGIWLSTSLYPTISTLILTGVASYFYSSIIIQILLRVVIPWSIFYFVSSSYVIFQSFFQIHKTSGYSLHFTKALAGIFALLSIKFLSSIFNRTNVAQGILPAYFADGALVFICALLTLYYWSIESGGRMDDSKVDMIYSRRIIRKQKFTTLAIIALIVVTSANYYNFEISHQLEDHEESRVGRIGDFSLIFSPNANVGAGLIEKLGDIDLIDAYLPLVLRSVYIKVDDQADQKPLYVVNKTRYDHLAKNETSFPLNNSIWLRQSSYTAISNSESITLQYGESEVPLSTNNFSINEFRTGLLNRKLSDIVIVTSAMWKQLGFEESFKLGNRVEVVLKLKLTVDGAVLQKNISETLDIPISSFNIVKNSFEEYEDPHQSLKTMYSTITWILIFLIIWIQTQFLRNEQLVRHDLRLLVIKYGNSDFLKRTFYRMNLFVMATVAIGVVSGYLISFFVMTSSGSFYPSLRPRIPQFFDFKPVAQVMLGMLSSSLFMPIYTFLVHLKLLNSE